MFLGSSSCLPSKRLPGNAYSSYLKKPIWTEKSEQNEIIGRVVFKITETIVKNEEKSWNGANKL